MGVVVMTPEDIFLSCNVMIGCRAVEALKYEFFSSIQPLIFNLKAVSERCAEGFVIWVYCKGGKILNKD